MSKREWGKKARFSAFLSPIGTTTCTRNLNQNHEIEHRMRSGGEKKRKPSGTPESSNHFQKTLNRPVVQSFCAA